ncbi:MAG: hypothetical protein U9P42_04380 [Candidatus Fermentibacteria bacterium]|nr:hypothetical protein [Candidatus Fermentibacteria bacterium]
MNTEIKELIAERQLSQWHLMIASFLGSLASQQGMFNQAFLNRLLKHSMDKFIIPYFQTLPDYNEACEAARQGTTIAQRLNPVVAFMDNVFGLAGQVEVIEKDDNHASFRVGSSGCRFCPIGVGKAELAPGDTFCPFPTMLEETANEMLGGKVLKTVLTREGMKTEILKKEDGNCFIDYEATQNA